MTRAGRFPSRLTPLPGAQHPQKNALFPAQAPKSLATHQQAACVSPPELQVLEENWDMKPLDFMGDADGLNTARHRLSMVQHVQRSGVTDRRVLQAMLRVERHRFLDTALQVQAYEDTSLPIGAGQTISKPNVVARMLALLLQAPLYEQTGRHERVLEIGTGCGYQAAVLSLLCKELYSVERIRELYLKAKSNLRPLRLPNVRLFLLDGVEGCESGAPFSGVVSAAGAESLPRIWLNQLSVGGRLVAPVQNQTGKQSLWVVDRTPNGFKQSVLEDVQFVPLKSGIE